MAKSKCLGCKEEVSMKEMKEVDTYVDEQDCICDIINLPGGLLPLQEPQVWLHPGVYIAEQGVTGPFGARDGEEIKVLRPNICKICSGLPEWGEGDDLEDVRDEEKDKQQERREFPRGAKQVGEETYPKDED